ncbi:MAG TPA: NADPH:quinone reductase [Frankiaceae bacterium]|nr:NADPH:quinone reductase [Frankiaceae bacterium]
MRAVVYDRNGGPEVLHEVDLPTPEPGPGEVRVAVRRSGVNPTDWKSRQGSGPDTPVEPAHTPNQDGSGVVEAVGEGVDDALVGRAVWLWEAARDRPRGGTAQQQTVLPVRHVVPLPGSADPGSAVLDSANFDLGASLGVPFLTAHRCLTVTEGGPSSLGPGALQGHVVLVAGGAGAVGNAAIQLARWADATVITTISNPHKAQLAAAAGADHVIDYRQQDVVAEIRRIAPHGVHSIVEVSPGKNAAIDAQVLAMHGSVAVYADDNTSEVSIPVRASMLPNVRWQFVLVYTEPAVAKATGIADVSAAVRAGAIRVGEAAGLPLHHFPLADVAGAHQAVQDGTVGKVLIDVTN